VKIAEIYRSVQGEGLLTGTASVFVRPSGCNLRCWFCDTPYASWQPEGRDLSVDEIVAQVEEWDCRHVVLTGGEPMLFSESIPLTAALRAGGRYITIETAGTLYLPVTCELMSISPKLASSGPPASVGARWKRRHQRVRLQPDVLNRLIDEYPYQLKFVVDSPADCREVLSVLDALRSPDRRRVLLMPQGTDSETLAATASWLRPFCRQHELTYCPRRQIEWFGSVRGT